MHKSAGKMMALVLRVRKGVLLDFMERAQDLMQRHKSETLERLEVTSRRQRPGLLTTGVLLLQDNVGTPRSTSTT
jgi:hypothetical protein